MGWGDLLLPLNRVSWWNWSTSANKKKSEIKITNVMNKLIDLKN